MCLSRTAGGVSVAFPPSGGCPAPQPVRSVPDKDSPSQSAVAASPIHLLCTQHLTFTSETMGLSGVPNIVAKPELTVNLRCPAGEAARCCVGARLARR